MNLCDYFYGIGRRGEIDLVGSLSPEPPKQPISFKQWHDRYIKSNTLACTVTISPKNASLQDCWGLTHAVQLARFKRFMKNYVKKHLNCVYMCTEVQPKTNNLHWHGVISVCDYAEKVMLLHKLRNKFGRSEIVPIYNTQSWYNYIHKENGEKIEYNPNPTATLEP